MLGRPADRIWTQIQQELQEQILLVKLHRQQRQQLLLHQHLALGQCRTICPFCSLLRTLPCLRHPLLLHQGLCQTRALCNSPRPGHSPAGQQSPTAALQGPLQPPTDPQQLRMTPRTQKPLSQVVGAVLCRPITLHRHLKPAALAWLKLGASQHLMMFWLSFLAALQELQPHHMNQLLSLQVN